MGRTREIAQEITALEQIFLRNVYHTILKDIALPPSQLVALVAVCEKKTCCLSDLSREMHISNPTVTGIIDRLENGGYVKRVRNTQDRRVTNIVATKKGEKTAGDFLSNVTRKWESLLEPLSMKDQENWLRLFKDILEGMIAREK